MPTLTPETSTFEPTPLHGSVKYGPNGLYSVDSFPNSHLQDQWKEMLASAANFSLAKKTWSTYSTAIRMLDKCGTETGSNMQFPLDENNTLTFIAWLMNRGLSTSTINSYLSGIRQAHLVRGIEIPVLRTSIVTQILEGTKKIDALKARLGAKPKRLAITPLILRTWKAELCSSQHSNTDKLMLWTISVLAFQGSFRIHELLNRHTTTFDPAFSLLHGDLTTRAITISSERVNIIQIAIKSEKTDRIGVDTLVDVYESKGPLCPYRALTKWRSVSKHSNPNMPAFRWESGKPITGQEFNKSLKTLLQKHFDYQKGSITSHSFRAGLATMMGTLGYTDAEVQALGRWSSRSFEAYMKLPRTRRLQMAREIGKLNL